MQIKVYRTVYRHTVAELIVEQADAEKEHIGLTTWESTPDGKSACLNLGKRIGLYSFQKSEKVPPMVAEISDKNN